MMTLRRFKQGVKEIPGATGWYLGDLGEAKGRQELFTKQSPQKLKALREHALVESTVSSNRIEGVVVESSRIMTVVLGKSFLQDRDEEEVRGYRDALKLIHEQSESLSLSEDTIRKLHYLTRAKVGDAGEYKAKDGDIIETLPSGGQRIRFRTVPASETSPAMAELLELWRDCLDQRWVPPLIAIAAFNLDFLCIHPFRDGNGRVSRLLLLLQLYHAGYEVGRYISLERLIEQTKDRYYETLEESSQGWHEGTHDPWPYINYVLSTLKHAYQEFEERVGQVKSPRGAKAELVEACVERYPGDFSVPMIERDCPGVSRDHIRKVLQNLRKAGRVECIGRGPGTKWRRKG